VHACLGVCSRNKYSWRHICRMLSASTALGKASVTNCFGKSHCVPPISGEGQKPAGVRFCNDSLERRMKTRPLIRTHTFSMKLQDPVKPISLRNYSYLEKRDFRATGDRTRNSWFLKSKTGRAGRYRSEALHLHWTGTQFKSRSCCQLSRMKIFVIFFSLWKGILV
jgi:hypothetical protein